VLEVTIRVDRRQCTRAERAAYALGAQGIEVRDDDPRRVDVVTWMPLGDARRVTAAIRAHVDAEVSLRRVDATWLTPPPPRRVGRFTIVDIDNPSRAALAIRVDGALGFGDGVHPTTILCLGALRRAKSVLDVGTGTGILAIAAKKLGAEHVVATDIDPLARDAARRAMRANQVRVRVQQRLPRATFELVIANLYLEPLVALAEAIAARVERRLIVSGFTRRDPVIAAFAKQGLVLHRTHTRDGWFCLELTRPR
jgi:ribosomal protein L11 methylase PrmA